jgi:hypothetical protein
MTALLFETRYFLAGVVITLAVISFWDAAVAAIRGR